MRWRRLEIKEEGECLTDESYIFLRAFSLIFVFQCVDVTKKCFKMTLFSFNRMIENEKNRLGPKMMFLKIVYRLRRFSEKANHKQHFDIMAHNILKLIERT